MNTVWRRVIPVLALAGLSGILATQPPINADESSQLIHQEGYADFIQGNPGNSGANIYVSKSGRVEVINKWDLNNDGYPDLLMSNDHDVFEGVDALIYWGAANGYQSLLPELWKTMPLAQVLFDVMDHPPRVTRLPAFGGGKAAIADLNRDGYPDIVFCNYIHYYPGIRTAFVYWGGPEGYSITHRTELPTNWASGVAAADLNGDGYPDLVFANEGTEQGLADISPTTSPDSFIYWGSATGFSEKRRSSLATTSARDVTVADLNKDGFPDIAFINSGDESPNVQIFWGSATGYSNAHVQTVPVPQPTSVHAADVNGDGYPDLIVTTAGQPLTIRTRKLHEATQEVQQSTYVFLGSAGGIDAARNVKLPSHQAQGACVGDFNRDGYADIAIANSSEGLSSPVPSYVYWGAAAGFSAERRTELPTLSATGVACADLNHDGFTDLVFANSDDGKTHDVPSYIYWGSKDGVAPYVRSTVQTFGAAGVDVADLNNDSKPDLLFVNRYSGTQYSAEVNSHIFWGNPAHNYSTASMTNLPGHGTYGTTVADLNDDGFPDVVMCNSSSSDSYIYWGSTDGFSADRRTSLAVGSAFIVHAADLNRDGYLDLVFGVVADGRNVATIFWGSPQGYSSSNKTVLQMKSAKRGSNNSFQIADLNRDGYLDLAFYGGYFGELQIFWGSKEGFSESRTWTKEMHVGGEITLADLNGDGYLDYILSGGFDPARKSHNAPTRIFWGTADGTPSPNGAIELEGYDSEQCAVADLNRDGNLDIVCSNYMSDSTRELPIFVYWGSKGGHYSNANRTDLPAHSSLGLQLIDLNDDGYPEIVVHNHLEGTRHTNNSYIYWNSPQGFDLHHRTDLPNSGPHYSQMLDPGNLYTRKQEEDYVSAPIEISSGKNAAQIRWQGEERNGTKLQFQVRTAQQQANLSKATWLGPDGANSFFLKSGTGLNLPSKGDRWIQYRVRFTSPNGGDWPVLTRVEFTLE